MTEFEGMVSQLLFSGGNEIFLLSIQLQAMINLFIGVLIKWDIWVHVVDEARLNQNTRISGQKKVSFSISHWSRGTSLQPRPVSSEGNHYVVSEVQREICCSCLHWRERNKMRGRERQSQTKS